MSQQSQHEENIRVYRGGSEYSSQEARGQDESYAYTPQLSRSDVEERFQPHEEWRQKASVVQDSRQTLSAGQRMALAIVSVSVLVPLVGILIAANISSENAGDPLIIGSRLLGLLLVCLTIVGVNWTFNRHR
jgi:hypothetical protein